MCILYITAVHLAHCHEDGYVHPVLRIPEIQFHVSGSVKHYADRDDTGQLSKYVRCRMAKYKGVVDIIYLESKKLNIYKLHSFTAAIYSFLHYQQYEATTSAPRLVVELG